MHKYNTGDKIMMVLNGISYTYEITRALNVNYITGDSNYEAVMRASIEGEPDCASYDVMNIDDHDIELLVNTCNAAIVRPVVVRKDTMTKHKEACSCKSSDLFNFGCKCGFLASGSL